jgi:hypothetical protein
MARIGPLLTVLGVFLTFISVRPASANPGTSLLEMMKTAAYSDQLGNPSFVETTFHLSLTPFRNAPPASREACLKTPFTNGYLGTGDWYHPLPTGLQNIKYPDFHGPLGPVKRGVIGSPTIVYRLSCSPSEADGTNAYLAISNIPRYACISEAQIRAAFPINHDGSGLSPPEVWPFPDFAYLHNSTGGVNPTAQTIVIFWLTQPKSGAAAGWSDPVHQPECLLDVQIESPWPQ